MPNLLDVDHSILERNLTLKELEGSDKDASPESLFNIKPKELDDILWKPVKPQPGYCLKLRTCEGDKIFVNVCQTDDIPEPEEISEEKLLQMLVDDGEPSFRIPISIGDLHIESDKSRNPCSVYDIAVNAKFFKKMETSETFNIFFLNVSIQALQEKYSLDLDLKSNNPFLLLKNRKSIGNLQIHRIQQRPVKKAPGKLIEEISPKTSLKSNMMEVIGETVSDKSNSLYNKQIKSSGKCETSNETVIESNGTNNLAPTVKTSLQSSGLSFVSLNSNNRDQSNLSLDGGEKGIKENRITKDFLESNSSKIKTNPVEKRLGESSTSLEIERFKGHKGQGDSATQDCSGFFCIRQFPEFGHPRQMIASLHLNVKSSRDFDLELDTNRVSVTTRGSLKPWFEFTLPYEIDVNKVEACFVTHSQRLMIKMDVVKS